MAVSELAARIAFASTRLPIEEARVFLTRVQGEMAAMEMPQSQMPSDLRLPRALATREQRQLLLEQGVEEEKFLEAHNVRAIYFTDPDYPQRLLECEDAPLMLYCLGDCDLNHARVISVVGTRHATLYGIEAVGQLVKELKAQMADPLLVVSGLALGVDIAAHRAAMDCGVPTAAVLAQGLNTIYPPQHRSAAVKIVQSGGMLLTDYRSCDVLHKGNFLARNRIIAGLADCVVVAESSERGGALNTARLAQEYDREVFAMPGRWNDPYSKGCNNLIATNRAQILLSASQLIDEMGWGRKAEVGEQLPLPDLDLSPTERAILSLLEMKGEAMVPEIMAVTGLGQREASSLLIGMEFRSLVTAMPGGRYRLGQK